MGGRNPNNFIRLRSLLHHVPGTVWLAVCDDCGHAAGLPVRQLLARNGELYPVERAMVRTRSGECGGASVTPRLARLCRPGCRWQRGWGQGSGRSV
jgi:hypothetical protein